MLIIMRGLPGSGKSTLAQKIAKEIGARICSADNFFHKETYNYNFNAKWLGLAHLECQYDTYDYLLNATPVIVDNTNILKQHFKIYEDIAEYCSFPSRYILPDTPWAFDPAECFRRNTHGVPLETIERMARQFEKHPKDEVGWNA